MLRQPQPTIGLVVPCLNDAALLARCLDSFTSQTRPFDRVIVVDNGSTDESADVARSAGATVVAEARRGITWAARAGYDEAAALGLDLIVRTDADAWADPTYTARLLQAWDQARAPRKEVVGITGSARFDIPGWRGRIASRAYLGAYRLSVGAALGHPPFFGTNCSLTTSWWCDIRGALDPADTESHDDIQLSFAVRPHETVVFRPELAVGMDPRALYGARQLARRFARGTHSMRRGFAVSPPHRRLVERV
ncbi:Glycosyltransferase involved in cell wall bisynthesis [Corynebacterium mycetoides]|uniref:4,4'-diaponeurosporenoate glycosyltransferase n=1 Tax=Corynebacterium mycetoides TaxID=38302 RepID=A0A1G9LJ89_9CORY|nr:glycosyltransferase [Corynebacterium mycetoides]SDL61960.1 Glycosyltransferase involved in cell wall bisynthesis [Corynebacterium mycetoides]